MPKDSNVGLSLKDAFAEALNEEVTASSTGSVNPESLSSGDDLIAEQPTAEGEGVLTALIDNPAPNTTTNNQTTDSQLVDVNGEQMTLAQLKAGFLRQSDYTKKTQELADKSREAENAITLWKALEANPVETVRKLSQRVNLGYAPADDQTKFSQNPTDNIDELVANKVRELLSTDPRLQAIEMQSAQTAVGNEFARIEQAWGVKLSDQDKLIVLQKAQATGVNDLEFVFAGLLNMASQKAAQKRQLLATSMTTGSQSDPLTPNPTPEKVPETFQEALTQAMQELNIDNLSRI